MTSLALQVGCRLLRLMILGTCLAGAAAAETPAPSPAISQDGLTFWLKADTGIKIDRNGDVSQWRDQSPAGNNATTSPLPGVTPPVVKAHAWNGKSVMHFDGAAFMTTDHVVTDGPDYSLFVVSSLGPTYGPIYNGDSGNSGWGLTRDTNPNLYGLLHGGVSAALFGPLLNPGGPQLLSVTCGPDATRFYAFGEALGEAHIPVNPPTGTTYIGAANIDSVYTGDIAELIVYNRALSNGARVRVETYLANKYGLYHPNASWTAAYPPDVQDQIDDNTWNKTQTDFYQAFLGRHSAVIPRGLTLWLRADKGVGTTESNKVTRWEDQSPHGNNALLPPGLDPPALVARGLNNRPAIRFNGATHLMTQNVVTNGQDYSFFVVSSLGGDIGPLYNGDAGSSGSGFCRGANPHFSMPGCYGMMNGGTDWSVFGKVQNASSPQLLSVTRGQGMVHFYAFGELSGTSNLPMSSPAGNTYVGGLDNTGKGHEFHGSIAELLVYDRCLDDTERKQMEHYLTDKYHLSNEPPAPPTPPAPPPQPESHPQVTRVPAPPPQPKIAPLDNGPD